MWKEILTKAKNAEGILNTLSREEKDALLLHAANCLVEDRGEILKANAIDCKRGEEKGMSKSLLDRLLLTEKRIEGMADGMRDTASLPDPVGEITETILRPNGLRIFKMRVPLGIVGIIYEARPNVTSDAFALCFKTGNTAVLKGGSDAEESNKAIAASLRRALREKGYPEDALILLPADRSITLEMLHQKELFDVIIPRGGAGLISFCKENAKVPLIETGTGNCHIYVEESARLPEAVRIILNAKTSRPSVCNACESVLIDRSVAGAFLPLLLPALKEKGVTIYGDEAVQGFDSEVLPATEEDYAKEYLDLKISIHLVDSTEEAIRHINTYNTGHSEAILTENMGKAKKFFRSVDASSVYLNASTRFTDGGEFGFGAEIGISTQKLHARGPMGLRELCSYKYIVLGEGQIRE